MLFEVDFAVKENGDFNTVYTALIDAKNVSMCKEEANDIKANLPNHIDKRVYVFIGEFFNEHE
ncbi:hypothetical protein [Bacillus sp. 03113]|uniref:hypothetical protein n=1 Tax=Bacillus sp. 03113 TaxID=2578211 RepID=UPI001142664A